MQNKNHPAKGSKIAVEPIKEIKNIKAIKKLLADKPRDFCLFTLGINTNLRASDLLSITVGQVAMLQPGEEFTLKERQTGKARRITINNGVYSAIQKYLDVIPADDEEFLFRSQREAVLTVPSLSRLVKGWCELVNLKGNYASHSLRKTWGYHQRVTHNVGVPELMVCFNNSSQRQTLEYLCIQPEEIKSVYLNEI